VETRDWGAGTEKEREKERERERGQGRGGSRMKNAITNLKNGPGPPSRERTNVVPTGSSLERRVFRSDRSPIGDNRAAIIAAMALPLGKAREKPEERTYVRRVRSGKVRQIYR